MRSAADLVDADDRWKELLYFAALDAGFYFARRGFIALSIEVTDADVEAFLDVVDAWCASWRGPGGLADQSGVASEGMNAGPWPGMAMSATAMTLARLACSWSMSA